MMTDEKKCPFCAETIRAEAIKCRYCGSDLTGANTSPAPTTTIAPTQILCDACRIAPIAVTQRKMVSAGGVIGSLLLLVGVAVALVGLLRAFPQQVILGAVVVVIGVLFGTVGAGKKTMLVCPKCRKHVGSL